MKGYNPTYFSASAVNPLVGPRSRSLPIQSQREMFELVGYLARPGRIASVEAEIPMDGRDGVFEGMFPGQTYRPITLGSTPSGIVNKTGPQFRINFASIENCPAVLRNNIGAGNGACAGRLNRSKFVLDLVQNYGFRFGDVQDVQRIRNIAVQKGYGEDFDKGFAV